MHAKLKDSLDIFSVIPDKESKKPEVLDANIIYLEAYQVFRDTHTAQIYLRIGGIASNNTFYPSRDHDDKIAKLGIIDPLFSELFLDEYKNLKMNLDIEIFKKIYQHCIKGGDNLVWGFPKGIEINLIHEDKVIEQILKK